VAYLFDDGRIVGAAEDVDTAVTLDRQGNDRRLANAAGRDVDDACGLNPGGASLGCGQGVQGLAHRFPPDRWQGSQGVGTAGPSRPFGQGQGGGGRLLKISQGDGAAQKLGAPEARGEQG
jgi:hypothetical protein